MSVNAHAGYLLRKARPSLASADKPQPKKTGPPFFERRPPAKNHCRFVKSITAVAQETIEATVDVRALLQEFSHLRKKFRGNLWAPSILPLAPARSPNQMIREYIDEQAGEQIAADSRFPIDNA